MDNDRQQQFEEQSQKISDFLRNVKYKIAVMSGKGGVGKSTVAVNLAVFLSQKGYKVGLLDVDIHGPSVAGLLGLTKEKLGFADDKIEPYTYSENLRVLSIQGLLDEPDDPLIWRGPAKIGVIRQFLSDADWGELDFLIIDSPPGTGDEPLTVAQTVDGCRAVIVTTPQEISLADVRKSIRFCEKVKMPVLGLVENMSGFVCPTCHTLHPIFKTGGGKKTAEEFAIPFLGDLPLDPNVAAGGDEGRSIYELTGEVNRHMEAIVNQMTEIFQKEEQEKSWRRILAVPVSGGLVTENFSKANGFFVFTIEGDSISSAEEITPPAIPGIAPKWLAEEIGCTHVHVNQIGDSARSILEKREVIVKDQIKEQNPLRIAEAFMRERK